MEYVADALRNPFPLELDRRYADPITVTYESGWVVLDDDGFNSIALLPQHWRPLARALTRLADLEGAK